jgi:N4-gp56 family major capsid protein
MAYNSDPNPLTLATALAMDGELRQNAVSRYFEQQSGQFNALKQFTSTFDPKTQGGGGPRSIFCEKTDLSKGGAQRVHFNVIGPPGGPGVRGAQELTGNTSTPRMATYPVIVDWVRDAFELTEDEVEMLAAGRSIEQTSVDLLAEKMGLVKQNQMIRRIIDDASNNVIRPANRSSVDALEATDVLTLDLTVEARARLQTLGAKPLMRNTAKSGCPIDKYLVFATATGMLNIRNDSSFQTAVSQGDSRGRGNSNFSGEILNWQGNPFYEFPVTDQDWDDWLGGPLIAKAVIGEAASTVTAENTTSGGATPKLIVNAANTKSLYFQWFNGVPLEYNRLEALPNLSANTYYAWACNPDGSRAFVSYAGLNGVAGANQLTIKNILAPAAGTSGKGATTVGALVVGASAAYASGATGVYNPGGSGVTLPTTGVNGAWVYTNQIKEGAVLIQANARGVPYTRSFVFGSMSACFAHGRVRMTPIKQERDYDFVFGRGFKMIFGTGVCKNTAKKPVGYLVIEHAIDHPGYPVPSYETA